MPRPFDLQGHRGARGLWPENTLAGFAGAIALGVTSIELDVLITADGVPVVTHDEALNPQLVRGPDGFLAAPGPAIATLNARDLRLYDVGRLRPGSRWAARFPDQAPCDGARIPHLTEVFALAAGSGVRLDIELKLDPRLPAGAPELIRAAQAVLEAIDAAAYAGKLSIRSFNWRVLRLIRHLRALLPLTWLTSALPPARAAAVAAEVQRGGWPDWPPVWAPNHHTLLRRDIRQAHQAGLLVVPWTVNTQTRMSRLIAWGVDGFCTDYPDRAPDAVRRPAPAEAVAP